MSGNWPTAPYDVTKAITLMGSPGMVRFFPSEDSSREIIAEELLRMVPSKKVLDDVTDVLVRQLGEWESLMDLRAIVCWCGDPADGRKAVSSRVQNLAEAYHRESESKETWKRIESWKQEAKRLGVSLQPLAIEGSVIKSMPPPKPSGLREADRVGRSQRRRPTESELATELEKRIGRTLTDSEKGIHGKLS